jgi:hypothetical protein
MVPSVAVISLRWRCVLPTHSAGGVRDHGGAWRNDSRAHEWRECEQDRRGIAPGVGDHVRRTDLLAQQRAVLAGGELGHSIDSITAAVSRPEIARKVYHACARLAGARDPRQRGAMRQRAEHHRGTVEGNVVRSLKGDRAPTDTDGLPALLVRRREGE